MATTQVIGSGINERTPSDNSVTASKLGYAHDAIVYVQHGANDVANGTALKAAYTAACALTPGGNALSATNRAVVKVPAGRYDFGSTAFDVDTDFIDLAGEGVCRVDLKTAITWAGDSYASAVSSIDLANAEFHMPDSVLICDTDTEVVNVTCRDVSMRSFHVVQETDNDANRGLVIDNATYFCDRGRFVDIGVSMPDVTRKAINDGTATEIAAYFEQCHTAANLLRVTTLSGACVGCTGGDYSFADATASGFFKDCVGADYSFAAYAVASGVFINCVGAESAFAGIGTLSGTCENCNGGDYSFGAGGTLSGTCENCNGGDYSFGGGSNSGLAAVLRRCRSTGCSDAIKKWQGLMVDCEFEVTGTNKHAVEVTGVARIYGCTLISNGTGRGVYAAGAQNAKIAHCRMNVDIHANVTNLIGTGYNVVDSDVSI